MAGSAQAANTNSPTVTSRSLIRLPSVVAIGFTGHRHLQDEQSCRARILEFLQEFKTKHHGTIYGLSSAAAGGDLLFAESCIQIGMPIRILLPAPKEKFRDDFDEPTWARAESVMQRALSVEVAGDGQTKEECYYECGVETVQQSQLLLALWDGNPSKGLGGTEEMLSFAKGQGRPVVWIHSVTGAIQRFNQAQESFADPELEFLNGLPESGAAVDVEKPYDLTQAWFLKIDESASHAAPQFRRLAAIPILCTAGAAICTAAFSFAGHSGALVGVGVGLGLLTSALPMMMRLDGKQIVWTRIRTATEVCRSVLALWCTPGPYEVIGPEVMPELSGMLASLNYLKISDRASSQTSLEEFKKAYREKRVQDQIEYFSRNAGRSDRRTHQYQFTVTLSIVLALTANAWMLLGTYWLKTMFGRHWLTGLAFAGTVGFQIATVAGALLIVNDWRRRRERYGELHHLLVVWDKQIESARTWTIALRTASRVERALLAEVIEWRSLIRNRKLPSK
jgi:hypothetical protein